MTNDARLTAKLGTIQRIHAIVCDKDEEMDRAGDVVVSLQIDGKWYEIIRLTEACNYFAGETTRAGLQESLARKNARDKPTKDDNWVPY
jgi:hypothetical protein